MIDPYIAQQAIDALEAEGLRLRLDATDRLVIEVEAAALDDPLCRFLGENAEMLRAALIAAETWPCETCGFPRWSTPAPPDACPNCGGRKSTSDPGHGAPSNQEQRHDPYRPFRS